MKNFLTIGVLSLLAASAQAEQRTLFTVNLKAAGERLNFASMDFKGETDANGRLVKVKASLWENNFEISLNQLQEGHQQKIQVNGIHVATVQGLGMNGLGEGQLRLNVNPRHTSGTFPTAMEFVLTRMGTKKKWASLMNKSLVTDVDLEISKNPSKVSTFSLLMDPPKVTKIDFKKIKCEASTVRISFEDYGNLDLIRNLGCNFSKLPLSEKIQVFRNVVEGSFDTVESEKNQKDGGKASYQQLLKTLENLKAIGIDVDELYRAKLPPEESLLAVAVSVGSIDLLDKLIAEGLRPTRQDYKDALTQIVQVDKKGKAYLSAARLILLERLETFGKSDVNLSDVYNTLIHYNDILSVQSMRFSGTSFEESSLRRARYLVLVTEFLLSRDWDVNRPGGDYDSKPLEMVMDAASDPESVPTAAVKSEYDKIIQLLKKRGAK